MPHDPASTHEDVAPQYTADGTRILPGPDGLSELDNPMPRWMTLVYALTALWGFAYLVYMPGMGMNGLNYSQYGAYRTEMADALAARPPVQAADVEKLAMGLASKPEAMAAGKLLFAANCVACHGATAQGAIGPNLTDATWLYGGSPAQIAHTVANGTAKGMPTFKTSLSGEQLAQLAAYVHGLGGGQ